MAVPFDVVKDHRGSIACRQLEDRRFQVEALVRIDRRVRDVRCERVGPIIGPPTPSFANTVDENATKPGPERGAPAKLAPPLAGPEPSVMDQVLGRAVPIVGESQCHAEERWRVPLVEPTERQLIAIGDDSIEKLPIARLGHLGAAADRTGTKSGTTTIRLAVGRPESTTTPAASPASPWWPTAALVKNG